MQPNRLPILMALTCALLTLVGVLATPACTSTSSIQQPSKAWVDGSRAVHDVIAPRLTAYLNADLQIDPITRDVLMRTLGDWEFMIRQGEAATAPIPTVAPAPATPPAATGAGQ